MEEKSIKEKEVELKKKEEDLNKREAVLREMEEERCYKLDKTNKEEKERKAIILYIIWRINLAISVLVFIFNITNLNNEILNNWSFTFKTLFIFAWAILSVSSYIVESVSGEITSYIETITGTKGLFKEY